MLLSWTQLVVVAAAALAAYLVLQLLIRVSRGRLVSRLGVADVVLVSLLGAVVGRGVLGSSPTFEASLDALAVLLLARVGVGLLARSQLGKRLLRPAPLLLVAAGAPVDAHLRLARIRGDELTMALRRAGVSGIDEVLCAVLEPDGGVSVIRLDEARPLDRGLLDGVRGADLIPDRYFRRA